MSGTLRTRMKKLALRLRVQLRETVVCTALGLQDSLRWQLLWRGALLAAGLGLLWLVVFVVWREEIWNTALLIGGTWVAVILYPSIPTLAPSVASVGVAGAYFVMFALAVVVLAPVAAVLLIVVAFQSTLLLTFRCASLRSLLPRVLACVDRQYVPFIVAGSTPPVWLKWFQHLRLIMTALVGSAICLVLPLTGGLFLLLWIGYLSTRGVALRALRGKVSGHNALALIRQRRLALTLVGAGMTVLLLVPVVGLLAPTAMAAAAAHLMKRSLNRWTSDVVTV